MAKVKLKIEREREREKINNLEGIVQSYVKAKKEMEKRKKS